MQPHISGTALAMLHDRAIAVVDRFAAELPLYEGLPQSLIEGDFLHGSRLNVELFFAYLRTGRLPDESDTEEIVNLAVARVRDGAPLAEVLNNYRIGASVLRSQLAESGSAEDVEILREVTEPLIQYLLTVTGRIAVAAADGAHDPGWEQRERSRVVADALLAGTDPGEWLPGSPTPIGTAFHVVVFRVGDGDPAALTELRNAIDAAAGSFVRTVADGRRCCRGTPPSMWRCRRRCRTSCRSSPHAPIADGGQVSLGRAPEPRSRRRSRRLGCSPRSAVAWSDRSGCACCGSCPWNTRWRAAVRRAPTSPRC
ncbi:hypothetical protein [Nocardia cyriacigeorgica]|uniref:hypothetical protein n=1 Tax=Nocardia cyriacigeorgica TaxID=135487 RepID=UPI001893935C|nr:hypothetical protein [Nocardia cyriacigeorgica]MBF6438932.1 hypothetical protein [Nocardia cyriacigeorgica]